MLMLPSKVLTDRYSTFDGFIDCTNIVTVKDLNEDLDINDQIEPSSQMARGWKHIATLFLLVK